MIELFFIMDFDKNQLTISEIWFGFAKENKNKDFLSRLL